MQVGTKPQRRKLSVAVGGGRRGSVAAGLETVPPATIVFHGVHVSVKTSPGGDSQADGVSAESGKTQLLRDISGIARAGELVAVMGPSGSGKTTLLTSLAGGSRTAGRSGAVKISGSLNINGESKPLGSLVTSSIASFVTQEECLLPGLTVRESLLYAAELQLPTSPYAARVIRVGEVLRDLRLQHRCDTLVRSLSGGEKRRLSIGCDGLLTAPLLMFLDEPTSGLSSTDALEVVQCLHTLAKDSDYTILCTIHQPPAEVFAHFSRTILLSGGRLVYSGRRRYLPDFFREAGCELGGNHTGAFDVTLSSERLGPLERDNIVNVADKIMDWISVKDHALAVGDAFRESDFNTSLMAEIDRVNHRMDNKIAAKAGQEEIEIVDASDGVGPHSRSFCAQLFIVLRRDVTSLRRSYGPFHIPIVATALNAFIVGATFYQLPHDADSVQDRLNVLGVMMDLTSSMEPSWSQAYLESRARLRRDINTGILSLSVHTVVWFVMTVLRSLSMTMVQMAVAWPMIGLEASVGDLAFYCFYFFCATFLLHSVVLLFSLKAGSVDEAIGFAGMFYVFWWQFRGWFVAPSNYNPALRWIIEINPSHFVFQAIVVNTFTGDQFACKNNGTDLQKMCPLPGDILIDQYDMIDRPVIDAVLLLLWMATIYVIMYSIMRRWQKTQAVQDITTTGLKSDSAVTLPPSSPDVAVAAKSEEGTPPVDGSPSPPTRNRKLIREDSVSISHDLVDVVDQFLHPPITLDFRDVCIAAGKTKQIVQGASGSACPGQLLAVMGPSGAGKTSLLNAIINCRDGYTIGGLVKLNGFVVTDPLKNRQAAFVGQEDLFYEDLTVFETFYYAAELQLGHAPKETRKIRINDVITGLKLNQCRDNPVSTLSGGERRRVSLGCHGLLSPARLLILDEPTTGLSSSDALEVMSVLSDLTVKFQYTVIMTIHQPRKEIFDLLDSVVLLAAGQLVYSGPTKLIKDTFAAAGHPLDEEEHVGSSMLAAVSEPVVAKAIAEQYKGSALALQPMELQPSRNGQLFKKDKLYTRSLMVEIMTLCKRTIVVQKRNQNATGIYVFNVLSCGTLQMIIYWRVQQNVENTYSIIGAFQATIMVYTLLTLTTGFYHGEVFKVEYPDITAGRHGLAASMLADFFVGLMRVSIVGLVFCLLIYFGAGFSQEHDILHFFDFLLTVVCLGAFADALVLALLYCSFDKGFVGTFAGPVIGVFSTYSGFFIKLRNTPDSIAPFCWINPIRSGFELFFAAHFGGKDIPCGDLPPQEQTVPCPMSGDDVLAVVDYSQDNRMHNLLVLLLAPLVMRLVACIAFQVRTTSGSVSGGHASTDSPTTSGSEHLPPVDTAQLLANSDSDDEEFMPNQKSGMGQLLCLEEEEEESEEEGEEEEDKGQATEAEP